MLVSRTIDTVDGVAVTAATTQANGVLYILDTAILPSESPSHNKKHHPLSAGGIAGIVIACCVVVGGLVVFLVVRSRRSKGPQQGLLTAPDGTYVQAQ